MVTITHETRIDAPAMRVFLLSLSVDLHQDSAEQTKERAVDGVKHGLMGPGETVTWQGRHFGIRFRHTSQITRCDPPMLFEDIMIRGIFKSFRHIYSFHEIDGFTVMRDTLSFEAPLGPFGWIAERMMLKSHLQKFVHKRNKHIQLVAESELWKKYLPTS
jgi:ligand-binding SRPBCC domain-containing protein